MSSTSVKYVGYRYSVLVSLRAVSEARVGKVRTRARWDCARSIQRLERNAGVCGASVTIGASGQNTSVAVLAVRRNSLPSLMRKAIFRADAASR
jgi:hypothetical protein